MKKEGVHHEHRHGTAPLRPRPPGIGNRRHRHRHRSHQPGKGEPGGLEAKAAFRKTAKEALQGGVAVGAGVAMANMLGNDRTCWWNVALTVVAAGVAVYGLERTLGAKES